MNLYEKRMKERFEQVECYSVKEYERRIRLTRKVMEDAGVDLLIIFAPYKEAYDQWLTGERCLEYLIIPKEEKIIGVLGDELTEKLTENTPCYERYLIRKKILPVHDQVTFEEWIDIPALAEYIRSMGRKKIGVVNGFAMEALFFDYLAEQIPGLEITDVTLPLSLVKNVKSEEEQQAIAMANRVHEKVMMAVPYLLRQGRTDREIVNDIMHLMCTLGSGGGIIHAFLINFGPQNGPAIPMGFLPYPGYVFKKGDRAMALLETNGPGGHTTAIGRFFTLGEPDPEFQKVIDMTIRTQNFATSLLKPGNTLAQIARETRRFVENAGFETNDQCFIHGLGGHFYEQCGINDISEHSPLTENMFVHAHPVVKRRHPGIAEPDHQFILDAFLVTPEGGKRTNNIEQKLFVIE